MITMLSTTLGSGSFRSPKKFGLTPRELEIVAAVLGGYSDNQIARKLSITRTAVVEELDAVSHKLGVDGRLELALFALHHRLLAEG